MNNQRGFYFYRNVWKCHSAPHQKLRYICQMAIPAICPWRNFLGALQKPRYNKLTMWNVFVVFPHTPSCINLQNSTASVLHSESSSNDLAMGEIFVFHFEVLYGKYLKWLVRLLVKMMIFQPRITWAFFFWYFTPTKYHSVHSSVIISIVRLLTPHLVSLV